MEVLQLYRVLSISFSLTFFDIQYRRSMVGLDFVGDLKHFKSMWKIRVKVIRLWKQYSCVVGETMEMVLADSKVSTQNLY